MHDNYFCSRDAACAHEPYIATRTPTILVVVITMPQSRKWNLYRCPSQPVVKRAAIILGGVFVAAAVAVPATVAAVGFGTTGVKAGEYLTCSSLHCSHGL